jgi:hypothetical protein
LAFPERRSGMVESSRVSFMWPFRTCISRRGGNDKPCCGAAIVQTDRAEPAWHDRRQQGEVAAIVMAAGCLNCVVRIERDAAKVGAGGAARYNRLDRVARYSCGVQRAIPSVSIKRGGPPGLSCPIDEGDDSPAGECGSLSRAGSRLRPAAARAQVWSRAWCPTSRGQDAFSFLSSTWAPKPLDLPARRAACLRTDATSRSKRR